MLPISSKTFGEFATTAAKRSKRINKARVPSASPVTSNLHQATWGDAKLSTSRIITASPAILTTARKSGNMKISEAVLAPLGCGCLYAGKKTSTPTKTAKRLPKQVSQLSPIKLGKQQDMSGRFYMPASPRTPSPNKLGRPLLSSTKLHEKLDNDRLTNAARLYGGRLRVRLNPKQTEAVQSYLLHENAIFDTFAEPKCKSPETKSSKETRASGRVTTKREKSLGAKRMQPLNVNYDPSISKNRYESKSKPASVGVGTVRGRRMGTC